MSALRPMTAMDLFYFNPTNLDHLTETYNIGFYLEYLSKWPDLCRVIEGHDGKIEAYSKILSLIWPSASIAESVLITLSQFWASSNHHRTRVPTRRTLPQRPAGPIRTTSPGMATSRR